MGWRAQALHPPLVRLQRHPALRAWCANDRHFPLVHLQVYRRLAKRVVRDIEDYFRSGFEVVGVVGIGGSPSCGVRRTLDIKRSLVAVASCPVQQLSRDVFNKTVIAACVIDGEGMFEQALRRRLARRGLSVPFIEHDLLAEMCGNVSSIRGT